MRERIQILTRHMGNLAQQIEILEGACRLCEGSEFQVSFDEVVAEARARLEAALRLASEALGVRDDG